MKNFCIKQTQDSLDLNVTATVLTEWESRLKNLGKVAIQISVRWSQAAVQFQSTELRFHR